MDELLARLRAALRRAAPATEDAVVEAGDLQIDLTDRRVSRNGVEVRMIPTEWHLVAMLAKNSGKLVTQRTLLQEVWGPSYESNANYLRVYMAQIRRKLEDDTSRPRHCVTEPGMGYRFIP
jgi:two-component system KDP operon response regulator KdpE